MRKMQGSPPTSQQAGQARFPGHEATGGAGKIQRKNRIGRATAFIVAILVVIAIVSVGAAGTIVARAAHHLPILMYHSIDHKREVIRLSVSPESFARQMEFLHRNHYNVVDLDEAARYLEKREKAPARTVAITFDDGYYNNYKYAYPILKRYGFPATIFVIVDKIGKQGWVTWDQIKEMSDSGVITIGSHTRSHSWLTSLDEGQLDDELAGSKKILEERLGRDVDRLCYPNGIFDDKTQEAAKRAGYLLAVTTNPDAPSPGDDIYAIRRIKISPSADNLFIFWAKTTKTYAWFKEDKGK